MVSDDPNNPRLPGETTLDYKIRLRKEAKVAAEAAKQAEDALYADMVPENPYTLTESDKRLDAALEGLDIVQAYNRWCPKQTVHVPPGKTESIKVRCPNPAHVDDDPSAWINTVKGKGGVINCRPCGDRGYDKFDIAAYHFGMPVPDYKKSSFKELKVRMAQDLGYTISSIGGETFAYKESEVDSDKSDTPDTSDQSDTPDKTDNSDTSDISALSGGDPEDSENVENSDTDDKNAVVVALFEEGEFKPPTLDWKDLVPGTDTFLDIYMRQCIVNEAPEEYHFFNGLLALGFAMGRKVSLAQVGEPVFGNLFLCLLGKTGTGKSLSQRPLNALLRDALPYSDDPGNTGTKLIEPPGSPEMLIRMFEKPIKDPMTGKPIPYHYETIHGLVSFNELSALIKTAERKGSSMKSVLMAFYDMEYRIGSSSLTSSTKTAHEPFCSLVTTTQPKAIRENLTNADDASGFLNRFAYITGEPKKRDYTAVAAVDIKPAVTPLQLIAGWAASFTMGEQMTWDQRALGMWANFYEEKIQPYKYDEDSGIMQRIELLMMKIMMLLSANKHEKVITVETVEQALKAFNYLESTYKLTSGELTNSLEEQIVKALMYQFERLDKKNNGVSIGALMKAIQGRKFPREKVMRVLNALEVLGEVEKFSSQKGTTGRPTVKYRKIS